jgi:hypothetical protein
MYAMSLYRDCIARFGHCLEDSGYADKMLRNFPLMLQKRN